MHTVYLPPYVTDLGFTSHNMTILVSVIFSYNPQLILDTKLSVKAFYLILFYLMLLFNHARMYY